MVSQTVTLLKFIMTENMFIYISNNTGFETCLFLTTRKFSRIVLVLLCTETHNKKFANNVGDDVYQKGLIILCLLTIKQEGRKQSL